MTKRMGDKPQAAREVGMSVSWLNQNLDTLPHYKVGRRVLFDLDELGELLRSKYRVERKEETLASV